MLAGTHSMIWDGKDGHGRSVTTDAYFGFKTGKFDLTRYR